MIITNALGSNYTTEDVRRSLALLFHEPPPDAQEKLAGALAAMFGVPPTSVQLFSKGRHALFEALEQLGIGPGEEVIIQAFTCAVLPEAIAKTGATPVYVDVAPRSLNPTLASIKKVSTSRTKALILQHTLGFVNQETEDIVTWSKEKKITIIQDLAHAFGAPGLQKFLKDRPWRPPVGEVNTSRTVLLRRRPIVLSFSQDKVIDGVSGGALISAGNVNVLDFSSNQDNGSIKKLLLYPTVARIIRQSYELGIGKVIHALAKMFDLLPSPMDEPENVTRIPDPLAFLAFAQLEKLPEILAHRRSIALVYDGILKKELKIVARDDIHRGSNLRYPIWVNNHDELEERLKRHGFYLLDHWYDTPVSPSWHPASRSYTQGSCPIAEELSRHIFNLPTHVNISAEKARQLSALILSFLRKQKSIPDQVRDK